MIQELISRYEEYKQSQSIKYMGTQWVFTPNLDNFMAWLKAKEPVRKRDMCNPCEKLHSTEDNWECKCGCHKSTRKSANRLEETGIPQNSRGNMRETSAPQHNAEPESGHSTSSPVSKPAEPTLAWQLHIEHAIKELRFAIEQWEKRKLDGSNMLYINHADFIVKDRVATLRALIASIEREAEERGRKLGKKDAHDQENRVVIAGVEGKARAEERKRIVDFLTFEEIKENEK